MAAGARAQSEPASPAAAAPPHPPASSEQPEQSEQSEQSEPGAGELRDAETLLELDEMGGDDADRQPNTDGPPRGERSFRFGLSSTLGVTATGGAPQTDLRLDDDGSYLRGQLLAPSRSQLYPSVSLSFDAEWEAASWLLLHTLLDTQEIREGDTLVPPLPGITMGGQPVEDAVREGDYIRELSATGTFSAFSLEVGRFRARIADGLVHDGFASGLRARVDLGEVGSTDLRFELLLGSAGPRIDKIEANTLGALSADLNVTPFESVGLFIATSRDRSGELSSVLRSALAEGIATGERADALSGDLSADEALLVDSALTSVLYPCIFVSASPTEPMAADGSAVLNCDGTPGSEGEIAYLGGRFHVLPADGLSVRGTLVLAGGEFALGIARTQPDPEMTDAVARDVEFEVAGWAGDVEAHYGIHDDLDLGVYAFLLSGDDPPRGDDDRYRAFIGLAPYWVWTSVFFSGWINQGLQPSRASAAGINGRGAAGIGTGMEYTRGEGTAELRVFWLRALSPPPVTDHAGDGLGYGLEVDLQLRHRVADALALGVEGGVLFPGDFFAQRDVAYRTLGTLTVHYAD